MGGTEKREAVEVEGETAMDVGPLPARLRCDEAARR
jgi:hypothetical protein